MASPFSDRSSEEADQRNGNASHPIFEGYNDAKKARREEVDGDLDGPNDSNEQSPDGGEKGSASDSPPKPVGFWDPKLKKTRNHVFLLWGRTSKICALSINPLFTHKPPSTLRTH